MKKNIVKSLLVLFVFLFVITIVGCSNAEKGSTEQKEQSIDSAFISELKKALEKRWDYIEDVENEKIIVEDDVEYYEKLISYEKEVYHFATEDFNDPKLKAIAEDYINGMKSQEESIQYYNVDYMKHDEMWSKGYDERSIALLTLAEEYGLKLNEKQFKDLKTNAQLVVEQNDIQQKIEEIVHNIKFNKVKTEYGWDTYNATVENTSGVDLDSFNIEIDLLDKDGVVIGTESSYHSNTWKSGQKVLFEFSTDITGFVKMEWEADYYIK
ncbi:FxLYD domain-containing protein [Sporosarcina sp. JAI121]|uniref:FxLYD domain-containing protein n=1 Tax=Sporosarcina sp. JAI121 TaxID=2723064 RepID=UPI0015C9AE61|nr:FxLYD domain-containing protein [Sporosarcina sp. JAI121]NYF23636.1 hypothetical protein [Sporosarcina sp. JAI121]